MEKHSFKGFDRDLNFYDHNFRYLFYIGIQKRFLCFGPLRSQAIVSNQNGHF